MGGTNRRDGRNTREESGTERARDVLRTTFG